MVNKELLDKIIRKSDICKFECTFDDISGVPVKYNEKYIMVNIYEDFQFDGFCIFDITEIENICYDETYEFINHICKEEKYIRLRQKILILKTSLMFLIILRIMKKIS